MQPLICRIKMIILKLLFIKMYFNTFFEVCNLQGRGGAVKLVFLAMSALKLVFLAIMLWSGV